MFVIKQFVCRVADFCQTIVIRPLRIYVLNRVKKFRMRDDFSFVVVVAPVRMRDGGKLWGCEQNGLSLIEDLGN